MAEDSAVDDPWGAFGSDPDEDGDDDEDDDEGNDHYPGGNPISDSLVQHLARLLLSALPFNLRLRLLRIGVLKASEDDSQSATLLCNGLDRQGISAEIFALTDVSTVQDVSWDALLVSETSCDDDDEDQPSTSRIIDSVASTGIFYRSLASGGIILVIRDPKIRHREDVCFLESWNAKQWSCTTHTLDQQYVVRGGGGGDHVPTTTIVMCAKRLGRIQDETCPWLARTSLQLDEERQRVCAATIPLSVRETTHAARMSDASIRHAVTALKSFGFCILPHLLCPAACRSLGALALQDLHEAADRLREDQGVDLYRPELSTREASSYRELSLREDFRMDLRNGPQLDHVRSQPEHCCYSYLGSLVVDGNDSWTIRADTPLETTTEHEHHPHRPPPFFRGNPSLLEIVRRCMNPSCSILDVSGNWGRYNFDGSVPGTFQDLRVGRMGAIISLPGAAEQALHADTPHLFEMDTHLPPHYINAFCPTVDSVDGVGQTALVHGSHRLAEASQLVSDDSSQKAWHKAVVRPRLEPGDVLLFDCRILHFGLANASSSMIERPILYTNMTLSWFTDPKNWDDEQRIFPREDEKT